MASKITITIELTPEQIGPFMAQFESYLAEANIVEETPDLAEEPMGREEKICQEIARARVVRERRKFDRKRMGYDFGREMTEFQNLEDITKLEGFSSLPFNEIKNLYEEMARYANCISRRPKKTRIAYLDAIQGAISKYWCE